MALARFQSIVIAMVSMMTTTACATRPSTLMWWEHSQERVTRALVIANGSPPMKDRLWGYFFFNGSGEDGHWAYFSPRKLISLSKEFQTKVEQYQPRIDVKSALQLVLWDPGSSTWRSVDHVSTSDAVYADAIDQALNLLGIDLQNIASVADRPQDRNLWLSRLRIERATADQKTGVSSGKVWLDVAPFAASGPPSALHVRDLLPIVEEIRWGIQADGAVTWCDKPMDWRANRSINLQRDQIALVGGKTSLRVASPIASLSWPIQVSVGQPRCTVEEGAFLLSIPQNSNFRFIAALTIRYPDFAEPRLPLPLQRTNQLAPEQTPRFLMELSSSVQSW